MLIIQIALGIVLGFLVLAFLPQILRLLGNLIGIVLLLAIAGLAVWLIVYFYNNSHKAAPFLVAGAIFVSIAAIWWLSNIFSNWATPYTLGYVGLTVGEIVGYMLVTLVFLTGVWFTASSYFGLNTKMEAQFQYPFGIVLMIFMPLLLWFHHRSVVKRKREELT